MSVAVPVLPAASRAVTVRILDPFTNAIPVTDHEVVPVAVPLPPALLTQVTCVTPTLSEAVPPMLSGLVLSVYVRPDVGDVKAIVGGVVSTGART